MSRRPPKFEALVVNAIRRLQAAQGSTENDITNYIAKEYDISGPDVKKQILLTLRRGINYGIIQQSKRGYVTCDRNIPETLESISDCYSCRRGMKTRGRRGRSSKRRSRSSKHRGRSSRKRTSCRSGKCGRRRNNAGRVRKMRMPRRRVPTRRMAKKPINPDRSRRKKNAAPTSEDPNTTRQANNSRSNSKSPGRNNENNNNNNKNNNNNQS